MNAIIYTRYGPPEVLQYTAIEKPLPGEKEVLVQIHAASLNAYDWRLMRADPVLVRFMGGSLFKPKNRILGADIAGRVEAVGNGVTQFRPGDEVYGDISPRGAGGLAEYVSVPENLLAPKPVNLTFDEAAAVPMAALTALQALRDYGHILPGQNVLIHGASGGVGTFAVQIARLLGGTVTAVCSPRNIETVRSLGADRVIDYTKEDFTTNGKRYDLIIAVNGYRAISDYQRALTPTGAYFMIGGTGKQLFQALLLGPLYSMGRKRKMGAVTSIPNRNDLLLIKEYLEKGAIVPVIDRRYSLRDAADAIRYLEEGHARGKVVITIAQDIKA